MALLFLHRPSVVDPGEADAASAAGFAVATTRLDVRSGDIVVARHFAWPWPGEVFSDIRRLGGEAINGIRGHGYAADILAWTADLNSGSAQLAPRTTDRFETLHPDRAYIVKGEHADKGCWRRMYAAGKTAAIELRSELMRDTGMRADTIVAREYVPLRPIGVPIIPGACPPSAEFRVFMYRERVLSRGYYWPTADCEPAALLRGPKPTEVPAGFIAEAASRINGRGLTFYTLDIGVDVEGRWWVIEVSDGLRAGLAENDPGTLYTNLANALLHF